MTGKENLSRRIRNCYISAPVGTNIENIRTSLLEREVRLISPNDVEISDSYSNVLDLISNADLIVGVLTRERRSDTVIFELGQAVALGRRVVVFAPPKSGYIPFNLRQFPVFRIGLLNRASINFAFDQILSAPFSPKKEKQEAHDTHGMGKRINTFIDKTQEAITANKGLMFERVVAQAIRESGVEIVVEAPINDRMIDLVVWSDVFQHIFGHPLLIELKVKLQNDKHFLQSLKQCADIAANSGSTWSLLIYGDGPPTPKRSWISSAPTVLSISAQDLLTKMRDQSFVDIVRKLRNQRVHFGDV